MFGQMMEAGADPWVVREHIMNDPSQPTTPEQQQAYVDEADTSRTETQPPSAARKPDNYEITDLDALVPSGKKSKLDANFAAIGLLKELQAEGRTPTREEQDILGQLRRLGPVPGSLQRYQRRRRTTRRRARGAEELARRARITSARRPRLSTRITLRRRSSRRCGMSPAGSDSKAGACLSREWASATSTA